MDGSRYRSIGKALRLLSIEKMCRTAYRSGKCAIGEQQGIENQAGSPYLLVVREVVDAGGQHYSAKDKASPTPPKEGLPVIAEGVEEDYLMC